MIEAILGDITKLDVDVVVNAANESLAGGGGVDGAIHRAAGPELDDACAALGRCATGDAKLTAGFDLQARFIVHAVGPRWRGGQQGEAELLANCYRRSLQLADTVGAKSIAFPAISTGIYGFPAAQAADIAVKTIRAADTRVERVVLVAFDKATLELYRRLLREADVADDGHAAATACSVCGQPGAVQRMSAVAPASCSACSECASQRAEPEGFFELIGKTWKALSSEGLVNTKEIERARTYANGRYLTWQEWLELKGLGDPR